MSNLRKQFGMVFQGSALFDSMTVLDNIMFPLRMFSAKTESEMISRAKEVIKRVDLKDSNDKYPSEISGGMKKRVAIARALLNHPALILADEPTGNLDPETSQEIMRVFQELHKGGIGIIMATHDYNMIVKFPGKIFQCANGKLEEVVAKN